MNQLYIIGICDDGINICSAIENMILLYAKDRKIRVKTDVWFTGEGLCDYLKQGGSIDILFLDIELLEMSGIEVANFIREQLENRKMQIIYISAKSSYAPKLFKTQPLDFLVKPITQMEINYDLDLAMKLCDQGNEKFEFQCGKEYFCIPYNDIIYFSSEGKKIRIMAFKIERVFYGKLKDIIATLPEDFIIIHKSYVINKRYVFCYTYEWIELVNNIKLPISKAQRKQVRERIIQEDVNK